jgi:hypothetical protein
LFVQAIEEGYVCQLCMRGNILVDIHIGKLSAPDVMEDVATMVLHQKCPISLGWTHSPDTRGNVKQCMDGDGTTGYVQWIMLVV